MVVLPFPTLIKEAMELFVLTDPATELTHGIGNGQIGVIQMGKVGFEVIIFSMKNAKILFVSLF